MAEGLLLFEVAPPPRSAAKDKLEASAERIAGAISGLKRADFINLPEIVEENYAGAPFYRNADPRDFGALLERKSGVRAVLNKVVAHCGGVPGFRSWLGETASAGFKNVILVGGSDGSRKYPGPSVAQADSIAVSKGFEVGNICIPEREGEAARMSAKTAAGCSFFTTQIIADSLPVKNVLKGYALACEKGGMQPAAVFLSFAPVSTPLDLEFLKWLGARFPPALEKRLLESGDCGAASVSAARELHSEIAGFVKSEGLRVPLGLNVEAVSMHNLSLAVELANALYLGL